MADQKISELPAATALDGTEEAPVVQSGETRRASDLATRTYVDDTVDNATSDLVASTDITDIVVVTESEYDALTPDASTFYIVTEDA